MNMYKKKTLIDSNLMDGQDHFIEVIRDGNRIALGRFEGIAFKDDENYILKVNSHPVYEEWLEDTRWEEHFQHKCKFIDATHSIEIVEYFFPDGFFSKSFDIKKSPYFDGEGITTIGGGGGLSGRCTGLDCPPLLSSFA